MMMVCVRLLQFMCLNDKKSYIIYDTKPPQQLCSQQRPATKQHRQPTAKAIKCSNSNISISGNWNNLATFVQKTIHFFFFLNCCNFHSPCQSVIVFMLFQAARPRPNQIVCLVTKRCWMAVLLLLLLLLRAAEGCLNKIWNKFKSRLRPFAHLTFIGFCGYFEFYCLSIKKFFFSSPLLFSFVVRKAIIDLSYFCRFLFSICTHGEIRIKM